MATSSTGSGGERLGDLPPWPSDEEGPVFEAPWQAQAFALAVKLSELGHFSWTTWAAGRLPKRSARAADARGDPEDGSGYYHHWVAALERLVAGRDLIDLAALTERKNAWAEAYRRTPHGQPVELRAGS